MTDEEGLTYAATGVDIEESEAATAALVDAFGGFDADAYAGIIELDDRILGVATDGVGTKLLVAAAVEDHSTVGIDCVAMNVNDLVAMGIEPVGFVDYLAIDAPDEELSAQLGEGLARGAAAADMALLGGETAVLPDIVTGYDLAGTCVGVATPDDLVGDAEPGDRLVGVASTGIHSNGLTLARTALTREFDYDDPFPPEPDRTIGEELLTPTAIYRSLLEPLRSYANAAAHVTGGGWTNLARMGEFRYEIEDPLPAQPIFELVQEAGNVTDAEMHRTFNMGTGFVMAVPPADAEALAAAVDGRVIGEVHEGSGVSIRGIEL